MIEIIAIPEGSSFFELTLDGQSIKIDIYYSKSKDRFLMDIENRNLKRKSIGIVINTGLDLLSAAGRIGLQALVLLSTPKAGFEAGIENFDLGNLQLIYMDLETYDEIILLGGSSRKQWIEQSINEF